MKKALIILFMIVVAINPIYADNLSKAKELYLKGNFAKALPLFEKEYKKKPKDAVINHWYGVCLFETGKIKESEKHLLYAHSRKVIEAPHYLAKLCFLNYDFQGALDMFAAYDEILEQSNRKRVPGADEELKLIKTAKSMFEHVEKIAIIDSIVVDKENFFKYYNISSESGTLNSKSMLPVSVSQNTVVHCDQNGDKMLWAMPKDDNKMHLCESVKLIDGNWDKSQFIGEGLGNGGDANYPYMMQDGLTLYFASNGEGSIGGYDIFKTVKDTETGEFLTPQNMGMPYNSFADDYMLVLDDMTGLGWWATDRNNIPDKVTIYVFVRNDIRENYDKNEKNLVSYAKILNYRSTWHGEDYSPLISKYRRLETNETGENEDFMFCVKKGLVYTSLADFNSDEAMEKMQDLLTLYSDLNENRKILKQKREQYSKIAEGEDEELKNEILSLEQEIEQLRKDIFKAENSVRKLELNN